jgi:hypothetical protein
MRLVDQPEPPDVTTMTKATSTGAIDPTRA